MKKHKYDILRSIMTLATAQAYLNATGGETQYYVSPQDIKDAFSVIYTDLAAPAAETQVTHPNTDDVLVQVKDTGESAWQMAFYDSGVRSITVGSGWTGGTITLRRINHTVYCRIASIIGSSSLQTSFFTIPTGFKLPSTGLMLFTGWQGSSISGKPAYTVAYNGDILNYKAAHFDGTAWSASYAFSMNVSWDTNDALPASLPGTLVTAAPN
jgi:hypothetical protein